MYGDQFGEFVPVYAFKKSKPCIPHPVKPFGNPHNTPWWLSTTYLITITWDLFL